MPMVIMQLGKKLQPGKVAKLLACSFVGATTHLALFETIEALTACAVIAQSAAGWQTLRGAIILKFPSCLGKVMEKKQWKHNDYSPSEG